MNIEFEATGGVCPYCQNEAREGVPYKSKRGYINHVNDCRARPKDVPKDVPKEMTGPDITTRKKPEPKKVPAPVPEGPREYTVLVRRDDRDKWDIRYHGGNKVMADRAEAEWKAQGKTVKVDIN